MLSLFSSKENEKEIVLIFDIGSASVAGAFVEFSLDKDPKILYLNRQPIKFIHDLKGDRFKKEMLKSLEKVSMNLSKKDLSGIVKVSKKKIKKAYCSLASPWFVSETKKIKFKKEKDFVITDKFLSDFFKGEEKTFKESSKNVSQSKSEVIERKLVDIKLNGYKVENPLEKVAKEIELRMFLSMSQSDVLDSIESTISKNFYLESFEFNSFTLASFSAIRDMYDRVLDFLLIDVTGEVTDVSVVKSGNVLKTMSFPLGKNSLIRDVAEGVKASSEESVSLLKLFLNSTLEGKKLEKMNEVMNKSKEAWSKSLRESLSALSSNFAVPKTVFFTADQEVSNWYGDIIKSEEFVQQSMTENPFVVSFVNYTSLDSYVSFRSREEKDTFIAVEAIFFNRVFELER